MAITDVLINWRCKVIVEFDVFGQAPQRALRKMGLTGQHLSAGRHFTRKNSSWLEFDNAQGKRDKRSLALQLFEEFKVVRFIEWVEVHRPFGERGLWLESELVKAAAAVKINVVRIDFLKGEGVVVST
ncbi:hypothetical protein Poly21_33390 [Allorhodopirellula heiligendammensis]|uniref:Uncharacterized protein n=1 Tax=Allorhodopirellula heiligendammensis TaxID=2714739 RepID=A0A5C6BYZ7_9BACT|nr:hypothetical protein Poly21_33390 [Allorhodopirellula heiligendammensis]